MVVLKFGGTSVGKPERMKKIAELVLGTPGKKIVVLSALSGTTNTLVAIGDNLLAGQRLRPKKKRPHLRSTTNPLLKSFTVLNHFRPLGRRS